MGKLRGLMDRMTHKDHEAESHMDAHGEDENSFMHQTSRDTGAARSDNPEGNHGIRPVC